MSSLELWSIEQVRQHLKAASGKSASRSLSRWGVKAVTYERGESGRPEARYDAQQVRAAAESRPGRGKRTDLITTADQSVSTNRDKENPT